MDNEKAEDARTEHMRVRSCESGEAQGALSRRTFAAQVRNYMESAQSRGRQRSFYPRATGPRAPRQRYALRAPFAAIRRPCTACSSRWRAECLKASEKPGTVPKTFGVGHLGFASERTCRLGSAAHRVSGGLLRCAHAGSR